MSWIAGWAGFGLRLALSGRGRHALFCAAGEGLHPARAARDSDGLNYPYAAGADAPADGHCGGASAIKAGAAGSGESAALSEKGSRAFKARSVMTLSRRLKGAGLPRTRGRCNRALAEQVAHIENLKTPVGPAFQLIKTTAWKGCPTTRHGHDSLGEATSLPSASINKAGP